MKKQVYQLEKLEPVIRKSLSEGGTFCFYPHGSSMLPLIVEERDKVLLQSVPENPGKYRIILYQRKNGAFVLHRIVAVTGDTYTMRGDHQYVDEPGISKDQMIGMVCGIVRYGKTIDPYHGPEYAKTVFWVKTVKLRKGLCFVKRGILKLKRLMLG